MHELSIAAALVDQACQALTDVEPAEVECIVVRVGDLSGVDIDALTFAFPMATDGTPLAAARLEVERVAARVHCPACTADTTPPLPMIQCTACGHAHVTITHGRELILQRLELRPTHP